VSVTALVDVLSGNAEPTGHLPVAIAPPAQ
jgi:hypothetical protein